MIDDITKEELNVLLDIVRLIRTNPFAEIPMTIKTHLSVPTSLTTDSFRSKKYKDGENHIVTSEFIQELKNKSESGYTGIQTVTFMWNKGNIRESVTQTHDKKIYENK